MLQILSNTLSMRLCSAVKQTTGSQKEPSQAMETLPAEGAENIHKETEKVLTRAQPAVQVQTC